jgi:thioredoxin-related protein
MKKILLLLTMIVTLAFSDVKYTDIFDAYDVAAKENKTVMIMLSQDGCPACEYMKDIVFNNKNISKILNKNFVVVYVDIHQDGIPDGLKAFATPTFYFLDKNEKILKRVNGGENAKDFEAILKKVLE